MIAAISSWCFSRSSHALLRILYRLWAGVRDQAGNAAWAAAIARSTAALSATGTCPNVSPVNLSITGIVSLPPSHFPPMYSR